MNRIVVCSIAYILVLVIFYWGFILYNIIGTPDDWRNFATFLAGMVAPFTALGAIYIPYLVFKINDYSQRTESYFEKIVNLYIELQETNSQFVIAQSEQKDIDLFRSKILLQIQLIRYYLKRFPDGSHSVKGFDLALNNLWFDPMNHNYFDNLAHEFESFCFYANQNRKRPIHPVKDRKGNLKDIDY